MAEQIAWTRVLGQAFESDRSAVFASIQKLRKQAQTVGTLKTTPQQTVETKKTSAGEPVIVIEPANPQVVYVPQYNTEVVYTQAPTTTVIIQEEDDDDAAEAIAAGLIGFTAGIAIGAAMDNHYYYGPYGWHGGAYMYNDAWDDYYDASGRCARGLDRSPGRPCRGTQRSAGGPAGEPDGPRGEYPGATHRPPGEYARNSAPTVENRPETRPETRPENRPDAQAQQAQRTTQPPTHIDTERKRESQRNRGSSRPYQRDPA